MIAEPPPSDALPDYALSLAAYHRAFAPELAGCVAGLPLGVGGSALDLPCGDGFFTACLADRVGPTGRVVGADLSPAFLRLAGRTCDRVGRRPELVKADAYRLPFRRGEFDLVWCAQSLISLTDPVRVLAEMRRVVRPGGFVAVLETDELHHVLLNWPAGLDAVVHQATVGSAKKRYGGEGRLSPSRWVGTAMHTAGLRDVRKRTVVADRQAPFDDATRDFLGVHLADLRQRVAGRLSAGQLADFDRFPGPDATLTCLNTLFVARR
jgi:SAM-dependent methyltransferase